MASETQNLLLLWPIRSQFTKQVRCAHACELEGDSRCGIGRGRSFLETPCPAPQLREDSERKPGIQRDVSPPKEEQPGLLHQMALINQECSRLKG